MPSEPSRVIAALLRDKVSIDLKTLDLCFLAGLYLRAEEEALASFDEDALIDMFEQMCDVADPSAERPRTRATHAIQKLREQRMLARIDGLGIVRSGDYALAGPATAIIESYVADEALTREDLTLLTGTLRTELSKTLAAAKRADTHETWRKAVVGPLRVTARELIGGIERRQRGLDSQQEEVQREISELLQADWFGAIERCQALLDATTETLRELNDVLLGDTQHLLALLQDIQALASVAEQDEAEGAVQSVIEQIDRVGIWASARQSAWSDYYQHVHRYLRDVVRLDPGRALSQRLRDQIAGWPSKPFYLLTTEAPSVRLLRPIDPTFERPPVSRPTTDRESAPDLVDAEDLDADIERQVVAVLAAGAASLSEVTARVLPNFRADLHYLVTGRVAGILGGIARVKNDYERPWQPVTPSLELEEWDVSANGAHQK